MRDSLGTVFYRHRGEYFETAQHAQALFLLLYSKIASRNCILILVSRKKPRYQGGVNNFNCNLALLQRNLLSNMFQIQDHNVIYKLFRPAIWLLRFFFIVMFNVCIMLLWFLQDSLFTRKTWRDHSSYNG